MGLQPLFLTFFLSGLAARSLLVAEASEKIDSIYESTSLDSEKNYDSLFAVVSEQINGSYMGSKAYLNFDEDLSIK